MKNIYDEIGIPSKKNYKTICKLTEPLKQFLGVDRFWRNSHKADGSYAVIGNFPPLAEAFFGSNLYVGHPYFRHPRFFQSGFALPELLHSKEYEETQGKLKMDGNCHHVLIYIQKQEESFIEYGFAISKFHPGFESIYLNHLKAIHQFTKIFEQSASRLIREADDYRMNISQAIGVKYDQKPLLPPTISLPDKELRFLAAIEENPEREQQLHSLTRSEKIYLKLYLTGNTTQEIAKKCYRSPRTIETHLEHAKAKLRVSSRAHLMKLLIPYQDLL